MRKEEKYKLLENIEKIHTTELGLVRVAKNVGIKKDDVVNWCKIKIQMPYCSIVRMGKNWYAEIEGHVVTVNAHSFTIITAHKK